jgi:hypothetical protein
MLVALGCTPVSQPGSTSSDGTTTTDTIGTTTSASGTSSTGASTSSADASTSHADTSTSTGSTSDGPDTTTGDVMRGSLTLVGHHDLGARGMNAALAIVGDHAYVGSRIDGLAHADTGVLIVDVGDPAQPELVGQIGAPEHALLGMTSRELRAIPDQNLLIVLSFACSDIIHGCTRDYTQFPDTGGAAESPNLKIYDVSTPASPVLLARHDWAYDSIAAPHEMHLWRDPSDPARVLLFVSVPFQAGLEVLDISEPTAIELVTTWDPFVDGGVVDPATMDIDSYVHSVGVSDDGNLAFLSLQGSGLVIADISEIAAGVASPQVSLLHDPSDRVDYSPPAHPGTHSAVEIPGRNLVLVSDEVYPEPYFHGCPWGWARLVDYADPSAPEVVGEYKIAENDPAQCDRIDGANISFTAHNSTTTEHLAIISWHAGGLHVVDTSDPLEPHAVAVALPDPSPAVLVEDPVLFGEPVVTWSTPIVANGLIHVVDIRNGLFIYEYSGPFEEELASLAFAEGNSNLE